MPFKPTKTSRLGRSVYIRVRADDFEKIEKIAKKMGVPFSDVMKQAIHFALENMGEPHA